MFSFLIKRSRQKAIEIETAFFSFPSESQGSHTVIISFMLHISAIRPLQTDTYLSGLAELFLKLSIRAVQVYLIIWMTWLNASKKDYATMKERVIDNYLGSLSARKPL